MLIRLRKQATTTPKARAVIQPGMEPAPALAERFDVMEQTFHKWRHRSSFEDRSQMPDRLQTTLTPARARHFYRP